MSSKVNFDSLLVMNVNHSKTTKGNDKQWGYVGLGKEEGSIPYSYFGSAVLEKKMIIENVNGYLRSIQKQNGSKELVLTIKDFTRSEPQANKNEKGVAEWIDELN